MHHAEQQRQEIFLEKRGKNIKRPSNSQFQREHLIFFKFKRDDCDDFE